MGKNTKKILTICALCVLLLGLAVPTAFASVNKSTATVDYGSTHMAYGGERTLYGIKLYGLVKSTTENTSGKVTGYMYTRGALITHLRDEQDSKNLMPAGLYWANADGHTGVYWAQCKASNNNHSGYCEVYHPDN